MTGRLAAAVVAIGLLVPVAALGQQSVEDCIAQGGPRYASPGDATAHQYVDAGGRCADVQDDDTEVTITPVGGSGGNDSRPGGGAQPGGTAGTPAPDRAGGTATSPGVAPTAPEPAGTGTTTGTGDGTGTPPKTPGKDVPAAAHPRGVAATRSVSAALSASGADAGLSSAISLGSAPGVVIAVLAGLGLAGAGAGMRRLNRR